MSTRVCNARNNGATLSRPSFKQVLSIGASVRRAQIYHRVIGLSIHGTNTSIMRNSDADEAVVESVARAIRDISRESLDVDSGYSQRVQKWINALPTEASQRKDGMFYQVDKFDVPFMSPSGPLGHGVKIIITMRDLAATPYGFQQGSTRRYEIRKRVETLDGVTVGPVVVPPYWQ